MAVDSAKASIVLERLEQGDSLLTAAAAAGVKESTFRNWLTIDAALAADYARAREVGYQRHADAIIEIADQADDPNKARVQIDARKWILSKMLPKTFGERLDHNVSGGITVNLSRLDNEV